ncbi:TIM barrel protein [Sulfurovum sp. zt1-1]|uniref:TIM barrel protein n=1 Tax=Sulfurovum zhangzhouensis TaxID=3019067 RepID=A0ABT7QYP1_9BACT|nr:TIM barrel protein [Sulfurovum zhangzhouensis]MDM5271953.1 TIM barrel protein [Sulfurovum zhangzhouensis]
MRLQCFKTMWGYEGDFEIACQEAKAAGFDGIEGSAPISSDERTYWKACLEKHGLLYIAEAVTGGDYVPRRDLDVQGHLNDLEAILSRSAGLEPLFVTCIGGLDAWNEEESLHFFKEGMKLAERYNLEISFETHRSRSLFNPWVTRRIVQMLPQISLTADISHWCVVCERQMDTEIETIEAIAPNVRHIHARVGYDQGPQVPHPAAPEYAYALKAHQQCWERFWEAQYGRGFEVSTMTPEFGPDGYLHTLPFTQAPVADLWEINCWMCTTEVEHFENYMTKDAL